MSPQAVNFTHPFVVPRGPDFHDTYDVAATVALTWSLPANVSVSLQYTNDTEANSSTPYTWTIIGAFSSRRIQNLPLTAEPRAVTNR